MSIQVQKQESPAFLAAAHSSGIDYAHELNQEQMRVVQEGDGHSLVLAGAGSGKTRTLVYRVAWLLEHGIQAQRILLLTFTNKAARAMLSRVSLLMKEQAQGIWGGTYHHIAHKLLRTYAEDVGYKKNYQILDQDDTEQLMRAIVREHAQGAPVKAFPKPDAICRIISFAANSDQPFTQVLHESFPGFRRHEELLGTFAERYRARKRAMNAMDFDDLLANMLKLLKDHEDIRRAIASRFQYVLVDEYQDTNRIQASLTRLLSSIHGNLLVVGDDAQSIYSFRAADVANILAFTDEYPDAKVFRLETNYRSQPHILTLANASIRNNMLQYEKELKGIKRPQELPVLVSAPDAEVQSQYVADRILARVQEGGSLIDTAVLFRASHQTLELELELARREIPYVKRGGLRYFEQAHIKDVLSFVRVIANPQDELAWRRLLALYRGIGAHTADTVWEYVRQYPDDFVPALGRLAEGHGNVRGREGLKEVHGDFETLIAIQASEQGEGGGTLISSILDRRYREYARNAFDDAEDRIIDVETLAGFAGRYTSLEQLLADAALGEGFKGEVAAKGMVPERDHLVLSTIHQAKGLEWKMVFVIGLIDGHFPNARTLEKEKELEEERRLFYVAVTRAKDELVLIYPETSFLTQGYLLGRPSQFVRELPKSVYRRVRINGDASWESGGDEMIDMDQRATGGILDKIMNR